MRVILRDIEPDDFLLAIRAVKYLMSVFQKDAILAYGENGNTKDFYVCRNKASITVRPCYPPAAPTAAE